MKPIGTSFLKETISPEIPSMEKSASETWIFDPVRKKRVRSTPEEKVRQNFLRYLHEKKGHPYGLMEVEKGLELHRTFKRCDILTRDQEAKPFMLVECKAPDVPITQEAFDQVARYNIALKVPYLVVTNGHEHYVAQVDLQAQELRPLDKIPEFRNR